MRKHSSLDRRFPVSQKKLAEQQAVTMTGDVVALRNTAAKIL